MDPQQELFTEILKILINLFGRENVYDGWLPGEKAAYPFVYIADSSMTDQPNKSAVFGEVTQTVHVWHDDPHKRGTVSSMMLQIKQRMRTLEKTDNFGWILTGVSQQILPDDSTNTPLLHGILELRFKFS